MVRMTNDQIQMTNDEARMTNGRRVGSAEGKPVAPRGSEMDGLPEGELSIRHFLGSAWASARWADALIHQRDAFHGECPVILSGACR